MGVSVCSDQGLSEQVLPPDQAMCSPPPEPPRKEPSECALTHGKHRWKLKTRFTGIFLEMELMVPKMGVSGSRSEVEVSAVREFSLYPLSPSQGPAQRAATG